MRTSTQNVSSLDGSQVQGYPSRLVQVDKKYTMMSSATRRQVTAILEDQVDFLTSRKQRSIIKRQQIKQLEVSYERQREQRIKKMNEKTQKSEALHQQQLVSRQKRVKKSMDHVTKVNKKVHREHQQELEKMLEMRHEFQKNSESRNSGTATSPGQQHSEIQAHRGRSLQSVRDRIANIEDKMNRAQTNSEFYHRQISERARIYSQNNGVLDKVRSRSAMEENNCLEDYYKRATHLLQRQEQARHQIEKEVEKKRKDSGEKLKKWQENLGYIDQARQTKYDQLSRKMKKNRQSSSPQSKREEKNQAYLKKVQQHQAQLELIKERKAEQIMKKHVDMTLRNRALKEKKEKIMQTMKRSDA